MKFTDKLREIIDSSKEFIKNVTPDEGIDFVKDWNDKDFVLDEIFNVPNTSLVSKHGFYEEFAIIKLKRSPAHKDIIIAVLHGTGDNFGEIKEKFIDELSDTEICEVGDFLKEELGL
jgi:hypothetical protein